MSGRRACLHQASRLCRNASTLVLADHNCESVGPATYNTITAAKQLGGDVTALVCGPDCSKVVAELSKAEGVGKLLVAQDDSYKGFLPEALSPLILAAQKQFGFTHILGGASAVGKVRLCIQRIYSATIEPPLTFRMYCPGLQ